MPTYDYRCDRCGPFEAFRPISERDNAVCPGCGAAAARAGVTVPYAAPADAGSGAGGSYSRYRHAAACACCPPARRGRR